MRRRPLFALLLLAPVAASAVGDDRQIPPPFAPLEYLVGSWKGQAIPLEDPAQRVRGWTETHAWAWTFASGKPTGMAVKVEGSKIIRSATLTYDEARKKFALKASPIESDKGGEVLYEGALDGTGKLLTLDRTTPAAAAGKFPDRLTLRPNANYIRYTLSFERKSARGTTTTRLLEVGLTKEGETFAAGSSTVQAAKCVVTGGAATQSLTYQGKSYPICCSGCRDEFMESPEKYLKKLAAAAANGTADEPKKKDAPARKGRSDDDF
ncbi:hypothetical protein [Paludisphaera rhizosphaerae]|uniref:hypothetical protein n=1 Tax=Paludisphaera rhizosphaerae TaxID=2711216 RepID=UPI00197EF545|nr:hypothetical protein [Paludisphaera rhizosphaerae]